MKFLRLALTLTILMGAQQVSAQLAGTKWLGTFHIPAEKDCFFQFKNDTLEMMAADDNHIVELMSYELKNDTLIVQKLQGGSPCDNDTKGSYTYKITGNKLKLNLLEDSCQGRSGAGIDGAEMTRVADAEPGKKE